MGESVVLGVGEPGWVVGRSSGRRGRHWREGGVLAVLGVLARQDGICDDK